MNKFEFRSLDKSFDRTQFNCGAVELDSFLKSRARQNQTVGFNTTFVAIEQGDKTIGKRTVAKYIWRDPIELYDLQSDPDEVVNLADDPALAEVRRSLSEKLLARLRETDDHWLERYQLPMPGQTVNVALSPPAGYAPPRKRERGD